jgi:phosphoglycolate phosphatase
VTLPQAILFDWDNTLIDSWPTIHEATNAVFTAMGHPLWTLEETKARVRRSLRETFPEMFGGRWEEARDVYYRHIRAHHLDTLLPLPGIAEMLAALDRAGIYLGVVSNKDGALLRAEAEHLGWGRHFGALVGAGDASRDKPACEPLDMALAKSGFTRGDTVWYVGDTGMDMQCACTSLCIPVLLRPTVLDEAEFVDYPPQHRFAKPLELLSFLGIRDS